MLGTSFQLFAVLGNSDSVDLDELVEERVEADMGPHANQMTEDQN